MKWFDAHRFCNHTTLIYGCVGSKKAFDKLQIYVEQAVLKLVWRQIALFLTDS